MRRAMEKDGVLMKPIANAILSRVVGFNVLEKRGEDGPGRNEPGPAKTRPVFGEKLERSEDAKGKSKDEHCFATSGRELAVVHKASEVKPIATHEAGQLAVGAKTTWRRQAYQIAAVGTGKLVLGSSYTRRYST
jgi:hypothetical protein